MSRCFLCGKTSDNLREIKNYTTSAWSQTSKPQKIAHKTYRTTTYSFESDLQEHKYQVCKSCTLKRDIIPFVGSILVAIMAGLLIAFIYYSSEEGIGYFFLYFCPVSFLVLGAVLGIWLIFISTERLLVRQSIQMRKNLQYGEYKGYTESEWIGKQNKQRKGKTKKIEFDEFR